MNNNVAVIAGVIGIVGIFGIYAKVVHEALKHV